MIWVLPQIFEPVFSGRFGVVSLAEGSTFLGSTKMCVLVAQWLSWQCSTRIQNRQADLSYSLLLLSIPGNCRMTTSFHFAHVSDLLGGCIHNYCMFICAAPTSRCLVAGPGSRGPARCKSVALSTPSPARSRCEFGLGCSA